MAKKKEETKALAVNPKGAGVLTVLKGEAPAHLAQYKGQAGLGLEVIEQSDLKLPRISLAQSNTPQLKKANPAYIKGLEEGDYFNSLTGEIYGKTVDFVPIICFKARIKFVPFEDGGGIDCQSFNAKTGGKHCPKSCEECPFSKFGEEKGTAPECDLIYNFPSFVGKKRDMAVVSLKSTGIAAAKKLLSYAAFREGRPPLCAVVYTLSSKDDRKKGNDFKVAQIEPAGWTDTDTFNAAVAQAATLKGKKIEVDQTGEGKSKKGSGDDATEF